MICLLLKIWATFYYLKKLINFQSIELNLESFKLVREKEANPESQKFEIDLK